jgi:hypothetical protein
MVYNVRMKKLLWILLLWLLGNWGSSLLAANTFPTVTHLGTTPEVQISDEKESEFIQLNPRLPNAIFTANQNLCIYTSAAAHNYRVSIESNNGTRYELFNNGHTMPVELWWSGNASTQGAQQLFPNQSLLVENGSGSPAPNCPNGLNANLQFQIRSDELTTLPSGAYSGTFVVMITAAT